MAPLSVVKHFSTGTIDVFHSMIRLLVKPKPGITGAELKNNKMLVPYVLNVYEKI